MRKIIFLIFFALPFFSCEKKTFENKPQYELNVNETVEIYYSTNSCCYYCLVNGSDLQHIELITEKTVDPGPRDCNGCNYVAAYIFKATTPGVDTVKLNHATANKPCYGTEAPPEKYVVVVK